MFWPDCTLSDRFVSGWSHRATTRRTLWALGSRHDLSSSQGSLSVCTKTSRSFPQNGDPDLLSTESSYKPKVTLRTSSKRILQTKSPNLWPREDKADVAGDHSGRKLTFNCAISQRAARSADFSSPTIWLTRPIRRTLSRTPCTSRETSSPCRQRLSTSTWSCCGSISLQSSSRRQANRIRREWDTRD